MGSAVFINGRFLTQPQSGMQRYASCLVTALDEVRAGSAETDRREVTLLVPKGAKALPQYRTIGVRETGVLTGHGWEQTELYWASRQGTLVSLTSTGPVLHADHVVAMHDAAIFAKPEHFGSAYRRLHTALRPVLAQRARQLITISGFSRLELARYCGVDPERFMIIPDSAEHILHVTSEPAILTRGELTPQRYFLCVGNQSPNKNIAAAVRAFEAAELDGYELAIVGTGAAKIFGTQVAVQGRGVKTLGRVNDAELRALYENAAGFLFPSHYEGFGVPPLEAMALGCPVISSASSAMPEVLGDAAVYVDADDVDGFAAAIRSMALDAGSNAGRIALGYDRSRMFSWLRGGQMLNEVLS